MRWTDEYGFFNLIKDEKRYGVFLDMGTGKTALLLALIDHKIFTDDVKKILVIAPKKVTLATWQNEIKKFENFNYLQRAVHEISGTAEKRKKTLRISAETGYSLDIISSSLLEWLHNEKQKPDYDLIIVDECSQFKETRTKRTKVLKKISAGKQLFLLSGTPFSNIEKEYRKGKLSAYLKADELYYLLYFLDIYKESIYEFQRDFCYTMPWEKYKLRMKPEVYDVLIDEIHTRSITGKIESDIKVREHIVTCLIDNARMNLLKKDYIIETGNLLNITASNKALMINKALQLSNGFVYDHMRGQTVRINQFKFAKLRWLLEKIGKRVVIFYVFKEDKKFILEKIKGSKAYEGDEDRIAWENGEIDYLVLSPFSDKYGLNLQMGGHKIVWSGLVWSAESYEQANRRIARRGQINDVDIYYLLGDGSFDRYVYDKLVRKIEPKDSFIKCFRKRENTKK